MPHWPPFWIYDVHQALVIVARLGLVADPRAGEARALLRARQEPDGRWRASDRWWKPPGGSGARSEEAVDWHVGDADDRIVTLRALKVLSGAQAGA